MPCFFAKLIVPYHDFSAHILSLSTGPILDTTWNECALLFPCNKNVIAKRALTSQHKTNTKHKTAHLKRAAHNMASVAMWQSVTKNIFAKVLLNYKN